VRRGDAGAIGRQIDVLNEKLPSSVGLFIAAGEAQLPLAREIGDAPKAAFDEVEAVLAKKKKRKSS
jgi:hypothetical protein